MKYLLLIFPLILFSCKTPQKTSSVIKQQEQVNVINRISLDEEKNWYELTEQEFKRLINERYSVKIKQIKYDTDKPVDSLTNKHPVKEEIDFIIKKDTDINEIGNIKQESIQAEKTGVNDNSESSSEVQREVHESRMSGLSDTQKGLMIMGAFTIVGIIVFVVIKFK